MDELSHYLVLYSCMNLHSLPISVCLCVTRHGPRSETMHHPTTTAWKQFWIGETKTVRGDC